MHLHTQQHFFLKSLLELTILKSSYAFFETKVVLMKAISFFKPAEKYQESVLETNFQKFPTELKLGDAKDY